MSKIATLQEIGDSWSIDDLADAHEALDIEQDHEEYLRRNPPKGN